MKLDDIFVSKEVICKRRYCLYTNFWGERESECSEDDELITRNNRNIRTVKIYCIFAIYICAWWHIALLFAN